MNAEPKERTYEWAALDDYKRSIENLQEISEQLDGVAEELELLANLDRLPPDVVITDTVQKIREMQSHLNTTSTEMFDLVASFQETLMRQKTP